jgi:hypothetical protein
MQFNAHEVPGSGFWVLGSALILAAASSLMKRKLLSFGKKFQIANNK